MHVYPTDLVALIAQKWHDSFRDRQEAGIAKNGLPDEVALQELISTSYQVSMMREEGRPITMRLLLLSPASLPADDGPPEGFLRLLFTVARPFNEYELRRLSPAVDFERSLIGIEPHPQKGFQIWGIINSGIRWMQQERGGSKTIKALPEALVIHVNGPGMLTVCKGFEVLTTTVGGKLLDCTANVFQSKWMHAYFMEGIQDGLRRHEEFRASVLYPVAKIQEDFILTLEFQTLKRSISVTKMSRHGGTFIVFPDAEPPEVLGPNPQLLLKYLLQNDVSLRRRNHLITKAIRLVTTALGDIRNPDRIVTWKDYVNLRYEAALYDLEESLYEHAQFIAGLASVDGAVVIAAQGAIGFGAMIVGSFDKLTEVAIAGDVEGKMVSLAKIESFGARHRSVYHLCNSLHRVMAIVVSQDGSVQLVKWRNGIVTCWDLTSQMFSEE